MSTKKDLQEISESVNGKLSDIMKKINEQTYIRAEIAAMEYDIKLLKDVVLEHSKKLNKLNEKR